MKKIDKMPPEKISKRRYPPMKCKKEGCDIMFIPSDSRQIFCCVQHRIDHNNDKRKEISKPFNDHIKKLKHNEAVLKKAYDMIKITGNNKAALQLLDYEQFNHNCFTNLTKNQETGKMVYWVNNYGIEGFNQSDSTFVIHRKN